MKFVVRSDPFKDIRPFIEHLWITRTNMCRNLYPDEFPRGTKEKHATKEQEDEFILRHFSADDLHEQGGRFLKQVLYSIAKYNEDNVLSRAAAWAEQYESFYANPGMSVSQIRNVLDEHQGAYFPDSFLSRAVLVINYALKHLRDIQDKESTNGTATERVSPPHAAIRPRSGPGEVPQHEQAFFDAARQASFVPGHLASNTLPPSVQNHQQNYMAGPPQSEHIRHGPSLLHGQSRGNRGTPRPSQRQENRGRHRRSSGSMHSPQLPMGPMVPLQQMMPINTATGFPDFDPSVSGFVDAPPGYSPASYQMPLDDRFAPLNMHANTDYYPPISYVRAPKPRMLLSNGYAGDLDTHFQHQIPGSFNQHDSRSSFQTPNSPRIVDPHSFSRFPDERYSHQRPHVSYGSRGGHRSSFNSGRIRRSSVRSGDGWQGQRESRPFEGPQRRAHSDRAYLAQERRYEMRENRSQSDISGEHGYPPQRNQRQPQAFSSVPDTDPDWSCGPDFIGQRRVDVNTLVMTNLQPGFSGNAISYPVHANMFRFPTHADANNALGIRSMTFDGVPVTLRVPFKFWKATDNKYFPPAQARQYIESGDWYRSRIGNHGFSVSENYQLQESGMSEHSTANSEAANQPPTSQFVSTNERCDPNLSAPVFEESATSDVDDTGAPFGGYSGPVLPSLSEASTPQKYSAVAQSILDAGVDDEQASQTGPLSVSDVTSTGATPVVEDVSVESASPSTQRASSPLNAAMIEKCQVNKESPSEDYSSVSDSNKRGDSSPKEDADDSFQTAAETPEPSTRIITPRSTPAEAEKSGFEETRDATPTLKLPAEKAISTTHSSASITESDDNASISTASQSLASSLQASDKTATLRSGPKQTESLSPFARQAQAKKKDRRSKPVKSKNKTKTDLEQEEPAKAGATISASLAEYGEKDGSQPLKSEQKSETEPEQSKQVKVEIPTHAGPTGDDTKHLKNDVSEPADPEKETNVGPINLEKAETDFSKIKTVLQGSKEAEINTPSDTIIRDKRAVHSENNDPRKPKVTVDEEKHRAPNALQTREVVSKGDQKTISTLSSVTALLTGALSSMSSSKSKAEELTAQTSTTTQSDDGGSTAVTQPGVITSTTTKKPKKNKRKKKSKNTAPVREEDVSSTETLAHETPAGSPISSKASTQPHYPTGGALCERTNMLDNTLSSLGITEGSVVELGPNSVGYRATNAGSTRENLNLRGVEGEVEKSRRKMQEMAEKEALLKMRKG
ncbi:hypothetical protein D6C99_00315 [Aureobasidium pullulans]|nr:hypothetical protein D6C99_00315 [Aureobasidium pullulans]